jgi:nitronate monooxygenase
MSELESTACASPPCYAAEVDPLYNGAVPDAELAELLNAMLEVGRASAKALTAIAADFDQTEVTDLLTSVQRNQARFCGVLTRVLVQLGATPSNETSTFHDEVLGLAEVAERLALLNSGMAWVVGQFDTTLPKVTDDQIHGVLAEWREIHRGDLKDCSELLDWLARQKAGGS